VGRSEGVHAVGEEAADGEVEGREGLSGQMLEEGDIAGVRRTGLERVGWRRGGSMIWCSIVERLLLRWKYTALRWTERGLLRYGNTEHPLFRN
jgi:hypothetical protein